MMSLRIAIGAILTCLVSCHGGFAQTTSVPATQVASSEKLEFAIAIHGGAGSDPKKFSDEANRKRSESLEEALRIGKTILENRGTSLEAVEAVIRFLEDDPQFNAGKGAVQNDLNAFELDASIMDGRNKSCGAVARVSIIKNPITAARLVMTETRHVLLVGSGAETFAKSQEEIELVDNDYFRTKPRSEKSSQVPSLPFTSDEQTRPSYLGTVGCVALDVHGNLAAGTSTGGLSRKKYGRVGDSPIIGAGTYADNETCAVSCTGIGEQFIRNAIAYDVSARMKYQKVSLQDAVHQALREELDEGDGGLIAIDHQGNISMDYTTGGMARAAADSDGRFEVLWVEE